MSAAKMVANDPKNRYSDILPCKYLQFNCKYTMTLNNASGYRTIG